MSKVTIIGGGSSTFVPQLMRLFLGSQVLKGSTRSTGLGADAPCLSTPELGQGWPPVQVGTVEPSSLSTLTEKFTAVWGTV